MPIPFPSPLITERLIIRTPTPEDAEQLNEAVDETFEQLHRWMPWASVRQTLAQSVEFCTTMEAQAASGENFVLLCFDKLTGRFILASGLHPIKLEVPSYMIGYWCRQSEQRKGYTVEAVNAIRDAAFGVIKARRVEIRCETENLPSRLVAERCGFPLEGEHMNDCRNALGDVASTYVFALTAEGEFQDD